MGKQAVQRQSIQELWAHPLSDPGDRQGGDQATLVPLGQDEQSGGWSGLGRAGAG